MNYFVEIVINPDAEMRENVLLNKVYTKFHKALVSIKATDIGVSFPRYHVLLGRCLRIHGAQARLGEFQDLQWLGGLVGYCEVSNVMSIEGKEIQYRTVSRKQPKMTQAKLRRLMKRGSVSDDQYKQYRAYMFSQGIDNPYLELESSSNGHKHRRYIEFGDLRDSPVEGDFDQFGLSRVATIPWF